MGGLLGSEKFLDRREISALPPIHSYDSGFQQELESYGILEGLTMNRLEHLAEFHA